MGSKWGTTNTKTKISLYFEEKKQAYVAKQKSDLPLKTLASTGSGVSACPASLLKAN